MSRSLLLVLALLFLESALASLPHPNKARDCVAYCGLENQFCCQAGEVCVTDAQSLALCSVTGSVTTEGFLSNTMTAILGNTTTSVPGTTTKAKSSTAISAVAGSTSSVIQPVTGIANSPAKNERLIVGGLAFLAAVVVACFL